MKKAVSLACKELELPIGANTYDLTKRVSGIYLIFFLTTENQNLDLVSACFATNPGELME